MQYDYERFTPDRFQEFCQSLIIQQYPNAQCYPVGQKDGGRDAYSAGGENIVFQVKFKRDRFKGDKPAKIVQDAIKGELEKINKLASRGARQYILITNIAGSSALDVGHIDTVQEYIDETLPIPGMVWWRADIDARLNTAYDLKWNFSEILTTADAVRKMIEDGLGERPKLRMLAINGYLTAQYDGDEYVKFKQAELQASDLLDLFIDVPVSFRRMREGNSGKNKTLQLLSDIAEEELTAEHKEFSGSLVGAATLLLHPQSQPVLKRVVIEGAPGQGKSTLAQYVCQTHRMKILDKIKLDQIPAKHRLVPVRVPFKVDLRDLSSWLNGIDPTNAQPIPPTMTLSLESFLAAQVQHASGGQAFSVQDLNLFLAATPSTIFLDGLDEVASMAERKVVVDSVSAAAARMEINAPKVQVIVTSRPAAVANMPRFDQETWTYFDLESISTELIYEYTDRWSRARKLSHTDIGEIKRILRLKLQSNHIEDLARNAMQLTILLNLVHVRGQALPDHRTELYDSYVDVFFNRESDKSRIVRENRQLLINLHGYLAWKMHSEAEVKHTSGRIDLHDLRDLISTFLEARQYTPEILDDLLDGVVQRIVALVSRVEGTFEFEVQPLREYFAARHLYDTAPYSPSGRPRQGTKPEIFEAIAPNPYWLNVTRFYAGCYSVGELAGLADQIEQMHTTGLLADGSFPRAVGTSLLADRVFSQEPRVTKRVSTIAIDGRTIRYDLQRRLLSTNSIVLELASDCGSDTLSDLLLNRIQSLDSAAVRHESGLLWSLRSSAEERYKRWIDTQPSLDGEAKLLESWFEAGASISVLSQLPSALARKCARISNNVKNLLITSGHPAYFNEPEVEYSSALLLADDALSDRSFSSQGSALFWVLSLPRIGFQTFGSDNYYHQVTGRTASAADPRLQKLIDDVRHIFPASKTRNRSAFDPRRIDISTWQSLSDAYKDALGVSWILWLIAFHAAATLPKDFVLDTSDKRISGSTIGYALRARKNRSNPKWWSEELGTDDPLLRRALVVLLCGFGTPNSIIGNIDRLDFLIGTLSGPLVGATLDQARRLRGTTIPNSVAREILDGSCLDETKAVLAQRFTEKLKRELATQASERCLSENPSIANLFLDWRIEDQRRPSDVQGWSEMIADAKRIYSYCDNPLSGFRLGVMTEAKIMPHELASEVLKDIDKYPSGIVISADLTVSRAAASRLKPVLQTARRHHWAATEGTT